MTLSVHVPTLRSDAEIAAFVTQSDRFNGAVVATDTLSELNQFPDADIADWEGFAFHCRPELKLSPFLNCCSGVFDEAFWAMAKEGVRIARLLSGDDDIVISGRHALTDDSPRKWHQDDDLVPPFFLLLTVNVIQPSIVTQTTAFLDTNNPSLIEAYRDTIYDGQEDPNVRHVDPGAALWLRCWTRLEPGQNAEPLMHVAPPGHRYIVAFTPASGG